MKKAPKEDPPLLARPETPDDFERFEAQAFEVRCSDQRNPRTRTSTGRSWTVIQTRKLE